MKNKHILFLLLIISIFLGLVACGKKEDEEEEIIDDGLVTIKFVVNLPSITPDADLIYIAGDFSHPDLEDWNPGVESGLAVRDGLTATFELKYEESKLPITIKYKWTRGSWGKVEKGPKGEELQDRSVTIDKSTTITDKVSNWSDLLDNLEGSSVVGNLDIVELTDERFSNNGAKTRKVRIWTPKDYNKEAKPYPVIYLHDGQNVFDVMTSFAGEWEADETMVKLMNEGFSGAIIVGIDNSSERMGEYVYNHDFLDGARFSNTDPFPDKTGDQYMNFIVDVVKPYVDLNYNTLKEREHTTIAGSSLGGLISLFGGLEHLKTFGNIIAFSTSTQLVNDEEKLDNYFNNLDELAKATKYFFYVGTAGDGNVLWPANYQDKLIKFGVNQTNIKTYTGQGYSHNEKAWATHLPIALKWLFDL